MAVQISDNFRDDFATDSPLVSVEWLAARLGNPALRVVDATVQLTFKEVGYYSPSVGVPAFLDEHIPGAIHADVLEALADGEDPKPFTAPTSERFASTLGAAGVGDENFVVVYDRFDPADNDRRQSQSSAARLWWQLRREGFENVVVLNGGLKAWKAAGQPVTSEVTTYAPTTFTARRNPALYAEIDDVLAAIADAETVLLNTVDEPTHRGTTLTFARPGHITGSEHAFYIDLYEPESGRFLDDEQLRAKLEPTGVLDPAKKVITYCGSGIAGTVAALAISHLGRDDVALYDGCLTEWAANPELPMETSL